MDLAPKREKILIVEPDDAQRQRLEEVLRSAGYEVSSAPSQEEGFGLVQTGAVDVFLLSADLADVLCCNSLAEIKGLGSTSNTRVMFFAGGGAAERARALDLGADDVLTPPWVPAELLARVRVQLREKHSLEGLQRKSRLAEEGQEIAHNAFQAIAVTEKMTRDAFSLGRALKIGVSALIGVAALISIIFLLFSRRADKETRRAYSVIAQLEHGVHTEEALVEEANRARKEFEQTDIMEQEQQLQKQTDDLRQRLEAADASEVSGLRKELEETTGRLKRVENQSDAAERVIRANAPSVCLLHVSVSFLDQDTHRPLRYGAINPDGQPLKDNDGNVVYSLEGRAPEVRQDYFGTGFIVGNNKILTNHHVAQPWWKNEELGAASQQGLQPSIAEMTAYFPDATIGIPLSLMQISEEADLAVLQGDISELKRPTLKIDGRKEAAISGQPLISLGYATGISAILARAGEDTVKEIVKASGGDPKKIVDELEQRKLIRPLVTQGHIGDILPDKIVYDAQTTSGGSGGPLINRDGQVIGVTFAVVRGFGGSNFGVPIRYAQPLLTR
ncbi:MAG TPA: trypsin-like peptidase domain-containing protein [Candidatus Acidoferrum sp.]|nr:trypsin-like peptidase domain-containing protein [Candidatus Acidoferrum sp.]